MAEDCLFCAIASQRIPADVVRADDDVVAFRDIAPQAPVHVLVIPRRHYANIAALAADDSGLTTKLLATAADLAEELGVATSGFRLVLNTGPQAGQTVDHVHVHLLGQRQLGWPPG